MALSGIAYRGGRGLACVLATLILQACSFAGSGPPAGHFSQFGAVAPDGDTVTVCSAHGCKVQHSFIFSRADIWEMENIMRANVRSSSPVEERRGIAKTLAWIETKVGPATGTATDRAGIDFTAGGDPTQQDCVDEATNATAYMMVMQRHGLIRGHEILAPMSKGVLIDGRWPHYFAVIQERSTGQKYAIDTFVGPNGAPPAVVPAEQYYGPG